jgi:hypothetical protein
MVFEILKVEFGEILFIHLMYGKDVPSIFPCRFYINDLRQSRPVYREATNFLISTIQMDDWKVVCGGEDGRTTVYDQRMGQKLWEFHNR